MPLHFLGYKQLKLAPIPTHLNGGAYVTQETVIEIVHFLWEESSLKLRE